MAHRFGSSRVLRRTVALVNAAGPPADGPADPATIAAVLRAHGEPDVRVPAEEVGELVEVLGSLFAVCAADDDDTAAGHLNALFARYAGPPRLTDHDGTRWHLHLDRDDDAPLAEWVATSAALAFAAAFAEEGRDGWGICRAEGCGRVFLRGGPGRRRSACSDRCATRERVRAHRRRARDVR